MIHGAVEENAEESDDSDQERGIRSIESNFERLMNRKEWYFLSFDKILAVNPSMNRQKSDDSQILGCSKIQNYSGTQNHPTKKIKLDLERVKKLKLSQIVD